MYSLNFEEPIHVHFIGIGGISMSGLAEILLEEGFTISGSDAKQSALTDSLAKKGATIYIGQKASNLSIRPADTILIYFLIWNRILRCKRLPLLLILRFYHPKFFQTLFFFFRKSGFLFLIFFGLLF